MPEIDVSEILLDSVIASTRFSVVRRRSWTDNNGISQKMSQTVHAIGSVTPTGDSTLDRGDDFQSQPKTLLVITRFFLRNAALDADGVNWQPDLVLWQGNHYLVSSIEDFSQFGVGFVAATCLLFEYVPSPPLGLPSSMATGHADFRYRNNSGLLGAIA